MSQDNDIARVAAALGAPGLKYRSFGNEPVRPRIPPEAKGAERNRALDATIGHDLVAPMPAEEPRPTMKMIAEALSPSAMPPAGPFPAAAAPAWPLLDALSAPMVAETREPARGTLVQLFGDLAAPGPATPPPVATLPAASLALPAAAFAPPAAVPAAIPAAGALPPAAPVAPAIPASPAAGPFPATWAPLAPAAATPAAAPGLVPADRVTTPLAEVLQNLGRGGPAANPVFAGLRLPGNGSR
ncbi:hypothetical protein E2C06_27400 [Dankookia rubra]|uniref:Uncharacterized protein n=1 Tax=Dankookia rubra TaxID=1442381 RepID=A0A4R5Q905_9PROT|nr:hypothetical protein [Dankookia rubra]TDH59442.1 hypothetical protein E2C06_27400 [Dankookia rubra]